MPRRGAIALSLTALALVLLLNFQPPADQATIEQPSGVTGDVVGGASADGADSAGGDTGGSSGRTGSGATGTTATATIAGPTISTRWGPIQVEVSVENGRLVDVVALQLPDGDRRSASISDRVEPVLRSQALQAQSADIDGVSGATYTSLAYARSLQAALDDAGIEG